MTVARSSSGLAAGALALAAAFAAPGLNVRIAEEVARKRVIYGIEEASDFLAQYQPDQLLFVWDHPAAKILDPRSLEAIGGYFLERGEAEVAASTLVVPENADANALIAAAVAGDRPAVIWLYNTARRSAAESPSYRSVTPACCASRSIAST